MKSLTEKKLLEILKDAVDAVAYDITDSDVHALYESVKIGEEAAYHTGSAGILGYFAIEGTILSSFYYDAPSLFFAFEEAVNDALHKEIPGAHAELINSVEFGIYN